MSTLYPSQQNTADEVSKAFKAHPDSVIILSGPSGLGKSTVISAVAEREKRKLSAISGFTNEENIPESIAVAEDVHGDTLMEIMGKFRSSVWRVVTLAPACHAYGQKFSEAGIPTTEIVMRPLESGEIEKWIAAHLPKATDQECNLLQRYSLGIPLLLERMIDAAPVTHANAKSALSAYLSGIAEANHIWGKTPDAWKVEMFAYLKQHLREAPDDLDWKMLSENTMNFNDPLKVIDEARVDHALPLCPDTVARYREWLASKEYTFVSVFIPQADGKTKQIMEHLGLCPHRIVDEWEGRLRAFRGNGRKVSFFQTATTPYEKQQFTVLKGMERTRNF